MKFRLRIYAPNGVSDFILPEGESEKGRFVVGSNPPPNTGSFLITASYVLAEHLLFEIEKTSEGKQCHASIQGEPTALHDTLCNEQPLVIGERMLLRDGDRLVIRQPITTTRESAIDDPLIALVFEVVAEELVADHISTLLFPQPSPDSSEMGGLQRSSVRLLHYLPEIYHTEPAAETFLARFLALFERFLLPAEWTINNFDLLLDIKTTPESFLPWLEQWIALAEEWDSRESRALLAHYPWRGTRYGLQRLLEIYTGVTPHIIDGLEVPPFTFHVHLPVREEDLAQRKIKRVAIERLIQVTKPLHTTYQLTFAE